jgi:hypothetical protein
MWAGTSTNDTGEGGRVPAYAAFSRGRGPSPNDGREDRYLYDLTTLSLATAAQRRIVHTLSQPFPLSTDFCAPPTLLLATYECPVRVPDPPRSFYVVALIFVSVQPSSTTLYGVPFPLPTPQGRRDSHLRTMPKHEFRMLRKATPRTCGPLRQTY